MVPREKRPKGPKDDTIPVANRYRWRIDTKKVARRGAGRPGKRVRKRDAQIKLIRIFANPRIEVGDSNMSDFWVFEKTQVQLLMAKKKKEKVVTKFVNQYDTQWHCKLVGPIRFRRTSLGEPVPPNDISEQGVMDDGPNGPNGHPLHRRCVYFPSTNEMWLASYEKYYSESKGDWISPALSGLPSGTQVFDYWEDAWRTLIL